jgi:hypothetical protein
MRSTTGALATRILEDPFVNKKMRLMTIPALALGAVALAGSPAMAHGHSDHYQANLGAMNNSSASGTVMVDVTGNQAHVKLDVSGLAETFNDAPYPHVQHIHIAAQGTCPGPEADTDGDGVISTTEGHPFYGHIGTTLATAGDTSPDAGLTLEVGGQGGAYTYDRTFELNADTAAALEAGTAVVVVHGLDPATLSPEAQEKMSDLVPELPLAATSPAACGTLAASQMGAMPDGAPDTGVEVTENNTTEMLALGGGLVLAAAAGGTWIVRRSMAAKS